MKNKVYQVLDLAKLLWRERSLQISFFLKLMINQAALFRLFVSSVKKGGEQEQ